MKEAYQVNKVYSIILMLAGAFGFVSRYIELGDVQFTALIPFFMGFILLLCTPGIKKENPVIGHLAGVLTLVLVIMSLVMLSKGLVTDGAWGKKQWIFLVVIIGGIWSLRSQFLYFRAQRRRKAAQ
jgi:uncharacterized membrane protein